MLRKRCFNWLKRKKEHLETQAKLAVATAELSVFENAVCCEEEDDGEDGMNAYLHAQLQP